jgi:hypothetical protein
VALGGTKPVTNHGALAWTRVAIDTRKSQLVDAAPEGVETLTWRAQLLTYLMATDASTQDIARRLGVKADEISVVEPDLSVPLVGTTLPQEAAKAASLGVAPYTLTVALVNDVLPVINELPVITVEAAAPGPVSAERLAAAAVALLESESSRSGTFSSDVVTGGRGFKLQPFEVQQVTPTRVRLVSSSSPPLKAIGASILVFALWVAGGLLIRRLSRRMRARGRLMTA